MSKEKSSSISIWEDVSGQIESLREALNTPVDESDSSDESTKKPDLLYHYTENDAESSGQSVTETIESLREILNTPLDETVLLDEPSEESDIPAQDDNQDAMDLETSNDENIEIDEAASSNTTEILTEIVDETDTDNDTGLEEVIDSYNQMLETDESDRFDIKQESQDIVEETDTIEETGLEEVIDSDNQMLETDESDSFDIKQESQDIVEETDIVDETDLEEVIDSNNQMLEIDESDNLDDKQEIQDVEIEETTEPSIKSDIPENSAIKSETTDPYLLKVDESREKLNRSLEMARELVNQQSEEISKQGKKRFQFSFTRTEKNGNHKSNTVKEKEKDSKKTIDLKPMVYEMLETKQDTQANQDHQDKQNKKEPRVKEKPKKSGDRAKDNQEREVLNHRNRLEKSRSLGVPVFVKKPVNLEQIRQLKSMITSQNDVKILVDTGSSQGRLLVISGQDPDTLINTLGQLSIVKNTTVEDNTINITL